MKRLTISMSDELFDKLDSIENKSLFIRKLIERELDMLDSMQDIDSSTPWERDIEDLKGNVDELFTKLSDIEKQLNTRFMQEIPGACPCPTLEPEFAGSEIFEHEGTYQNPFSSDNIKHQPEITDEKIPIVAENIQEDGYSFLAREDKSIDPQFNIPMDSEAEDIPDLTENGSAPDIIEADPFPKPHLSNDPIHEPTMTIHELEAPVENPHDPTWKMPEMETPVQTQQEQTFVMPEIEPPVQTQQEQTFVMPEMEPPVQTQQEQTFVMPEIEPPVQTQREQSFVMPELKPSIEITDSTPAPLTVSNPPFEISGKETFVMPELSEPEGAEQAPPFMSEVKPPFENTDQPFTMPDLKTEVGTEEAGTLKLPEMQPETMPPLKMTEQQNIPGMEKQPLFKIHNIESVKNDEKLPPFVAPAFDTQPENAQAPPFEIPVQKIDPPAQQAPMGKPVKDTKMEAPASNSSSKPDKLGSNILMYMPHGAKVKKDIIKSLISKQFSENEIEAKISELVSAGMLKLTAENENQYLTRP